MGRQGKQTVAVPSTTPFDARLHAIYPYPPLRQPPPLPLLAYVLQIVYVSLFIACVVSHTVRLARPMCCLNFVGVCIDWCCCCCPNQTMRQAKYINRCGFKVFASAAPSFAETCYRLHCQRSVVRFYVCTTYARTIQTARTWKDQ